MVIFSDKHKSQFLLPLEKAYTDLLNGGLKYVTSLDLDFLLEVVSVVTYFSLGLAFSCGQV